MKKDIKAIVDKIIDNNERMKQEDGHDMDEKYIVEDVMIEEIVEYVEVNRFLGPRLNLMLEVKKALIEEGYTFLY